MYRNQYLICGKYFTLGKKEKEKVQYTKMSGGCEAAGRARECLGFGEDQDAAGRGYFELNGFHGATLCLASISLMSHQPRNNKSSLTVWILCPPTDG